MPAEAMALTGPYGSGKSTLAAQIGDLLEASGTRYATLDLDWLGWYHDGQLRDHDDWTMMLVNLASVVANYRAVEVDHFVVAQALASPADVQRLSRAMAMPLKVVQLVVPIEVIERRLQTDPTTGRREDLEIARRWVASSKGSGFADLVVDNDRPVREVACEIIDWLGWVSTVGKAQGVNGAL